MDKPFTIWLTRPHADNVMLAAELAAQGIQSIISPVLRIEQQPIAIATVQAPAAILLTSRHAAHALAQLPAAWRALPVYCVGDATASVAKAQHFMHTVGGEADVLALLPRIATDMKADSQLLYLAGDETRVDVAALLAVHSIHVETHIAYHAIAETIVTDELRDALARGEVDVVALFSPRSAALACELLVEANQTDAAHGIEACCLSLNVVEAAAALNWRGLHACHRPNRAEMVDLMVSLARKTG